MTQQLKRSQSALTAHYAEDDKEKDETPLFSPSATDSESDTEDMGSSLYRSLKVGNMGRSLLIKMGWREGSGLGVGGFGRVEPIPISDKRGGDLTGIGKMSLDTRTIASSTANRRTLESERQLHETDAERQNRMAMTEKKEAQKEDVNQALKTYRCELCQKQYDRSSTFEAHLNSYDHHHKKRFMEMKQTQKGKTEALGVIEKRRDKERKREEREMVKMAQAAGIQLSVPSMQRDVPAVASPYGTSSKAANTNTGGGGGWKKIVPTKSRAGFTSIGPNSTIPTFGVSETTPAKAESSDWKSGAKPSSVATSFHSSGFGTLDTSQDARQVQMSLLSVDKPPPPPPPTSLLPPSPSPPPPSPDGEPPPLPP